MIQPGSYNITIQQGATFNQSFQFKDGNGDPLDMTDYIIMAEVWEEGKRSKYADFYVSWIDQETGQFIIYLTPEQTHTIPQTGYYDILVTNPDGSSDYWLRGEAILETGYTE